ncbi:MAG: hypothetical protein WA160_08430 [Pseudobdellovibrio sp.]
MKGYPKWFTANLISVVGMVLFFSGLLLMPTVAELRLQLNVPWRMANENRIVLAGIHVLVGFVVVAIMGALWSIHMRHEWRKKRNQLTGIILSGALFILIISGVGIFYFGNENLTMMSSLTHSAFGVLVFFIYIWHIKARTADR